MVSGNSVIVQMGKESTYGTVATATKQIKISNESLKPVYSKVSEGLATGGKGEGLQATMGIGVEGSISTLLRADMGYIIGGSFGKEETVTSATEGYKHTFKCIESSPNVHLPSWTMYVNRGVDKFSYAGCKINRLSISAQSGDYVKLDVDLVGKVETGSATLQTLSPSTLKALKFSGAKVYQGSSAIADVKSITIELNNNLDYQTQTTDTGDYYKEAEVGIRSLSVTLDAVYDTAIETMRKNYYKTDDTFILKAEFTGDDKIDESESYKMTITIPCCQMSDASANMGDPNSSLAQSMTLNAVDNSADEFVTVELYNNDSTKYI